MSEGVAGDCRGSTKERGLTLEVDKDEDQGVFI